MSSSIASKSGSAFFLWLVARLLRVSSKAGQAGRARGAAGGARGVVALARRASSLRAISERMRLHRFSCSRRNSRRLRTSACFEGISSGQTTRHRG